MSFLFKEDPDIMVCYSVIIDNETALLRNLMIRADQLKRLAKIKKQTHEKWDCFIKISKGNPEMHFIKYLEWDDILSLLCCSKTTYDSIQNQLKYEYLVDPIDRNLIKNKFYGKKEIMVGPYRVPLLFTDHKYHDWHIYKDMSDKQKKINELMLEIKRMEIDNILDLRERKKKRVRLKKFELKLKQKMSNKEKKNKFGVRNRH